MMTQRDPYVNMLRVTIAAFAAGLGGANAVTVLPFTAALGLPDAFARRVARNTQLILLEESNLAKVADPAAGSGGIEDLTDQLCRAAWTLFQGIEKTGGVAPSLESGLIQKQVAETRAAHEKAIATRKDPLTGTSEFPHLSENAVKVLQAASQPAPASSENALPSIRLAEPFEKLRDASDAILKATGTRPKVFLATLGKPADNIARATFAKNFFEAGGIEAVEFAGRDLAAAFNSSGAALACLCSSDEVYAREAADVARALAAAGATRVYLAGRPGDLADALKHAGVQSYVFAGCDALATLQAAYALLGSKPTA
jgi:methylmalonyl-CoA mutase